jgi:hypothetical protein
MSSQRIRVGSDAELLIDLWPNGHCLLRDRVSAHGAVRLVVRRVKDARYPEALFPVWRYHPL